MNDEDCTNGEKIQIISEEGQQPETSFCNESLDSSKIILQKNGLKDCDVGVADKSMEENNCSIEGEKSNVHAENSDGTKDGFDTQPVGSELSQENGEPPNDFSQEPRLVNNSKMEALDTLDPAATSELHEQDDLKEDEVKISDSMNESSEALSPEKVSTEASKNSDDHDKDEVSSETHDSHVFKPVGLHTERSLEEPDIPLERETAGAIASGFPQTDISLPKTKPSSVPSSTYEELSNLNDEQVVQETKVLRIENMNSAEISERVLMESTEMIQEEKGVIDGSENVASDALPKSLPAESHDEAQVTVEATVKIENVPSIELETESSHYPVADTQNAMVGLRVEDSKDQEMKSYSRTLGESFEFVAEDINQLIQKSVGIQNDVMKSTKKGSVSISSPPSVALVDPGCVKEVARSSEKMVAAVLALLDVLQQQLHEMSALTTGYVQMHRDIGFRVTECVDDLLRALYSLISKIEQIDLKMTPLYELGNQVSRLRKSMEQLDKLF